MSLEDLTKLQEDLKVAYHEMLQAKELTIRANNLAEKYAQRFVKANNIWRTLDRQLAMLDGRYHIEEPATSGKKKVEPKLDIDLLLKLAAECGIDLDIK